MDKMHATFIVAHRAQTEETDGLDDDSGKIVPGQLFAPQLSA